MWCSNSSTDRYSDETRSESALNRRHKGGFSGFNLVAMILGFVFFWPVGLLIVFWICSGRHVRDLPDAIRELWERGFGGESKLSGAPTDNSVFNAYQQTQYDRIREIKEEIKSRAQHFSDFRANAKRRADEAEFNEFMKDSPSNGASSS